MHASLSACALGALAAVVALVAHRGRIRRNPNSSRRPTRTSARIRPAVRVDCYLDAVAHLYTMCRNVKSIEIIEFGYEKSTEGTNGAKTEYCVDKHRLSMTRPYQAALQRGNAAVARRVDRPARAAGLPGCKSLAGAQMGSRRDRRRSTRRASPSPTTIFSERAMRSPRGARRVAAAKRRQHAAADKGKAATTAPRRRRPRARARTDGTSHSPAAAEHSARVADPRADRDLRRRRNRSRARSRIPLPPAAARDGQCGRGRDRARAAR